MNRIKFYVLIVSYYLMIDSANIVIITAQNYDCKDYKSTKYLIINYK